jgi:hypothetical protein
MHNLETFLAQWRQTFSGRLSPETLDELESHLRERIEQLIHSGAPEPDACQQAAAELGVLTQSCTNFAHSVPCPGSR